MDELWFLMPVAMFVLGSIWIASRLKHDDTPNDRKDGLE
jgi:hypothetical protein